MRQITVIALLFILIVPVRDVSAQANDDNHVARFQLAESYLRAGQFDRAISLLEQLYAADPTSFIFFDRLREAYENVKRYEDAIGLVERRLRDQPSPAMWSTLARLQFLNGDEAAAATTWRRAIAMAPSNRATYQVVYRSMVDVRLLDGAIDVLLDAREALNDASLFRNDLAALYGMTGRYNEAIQEHLALLRDDERHLGPVIATLSRQAEQPEALEAAERATEAAVRDDPLHRPLRELLSWIHLERGNYDGALNESRAIDRLEKQEGRVLLAFAQKAAAANAFDAGREAYEEILQRYPDGSAAPHAVFGLGTIYEGWARHIEENGGASNQVEDLLREAAESYARFLERHSNHPAYPQVLRAMGRLQLDVLRDLDAAEHTLREVVDRFGTSDEADEAHFELGRIEVQRGNLETAQLEFGRLVDRLRIGELAERARYQMALIHFYRGEFEAARTITNILDVNTSTDVANDALELKMVIIENQGPDSLHTPLRHFAEAQLLKRQWRLEEALERFDRLLAEHGRDRIADEARFERAEALVALGRHADAIVAFGEIPLFHPESHMADRSLFRAAILKERYLDDPDGAIETLTRLLTDYPGSTLAQQSRQLVRRLRGDAL